jgi:tRNA pseudouridine55 synthase
MDRVILIDKPVGLSSQEAVTLVKRRLGERKAGHTGTLDPIATGLLLVCTGEATKASRFLMDLPKRYMARIKLGERTDTFDAEGRITATADASGLTAGALRAAFEGFRGVIKQVPPMYSAIKLAGKPLYKMARRGIEVERSEREVEVAELELLSFEPPFAELSIACSRGTYVRSLVDDIGTRAGTYAHIAGLRRTQIGPFDVKAASLPSDLPGDGPEKGSGLTLDEALSFMQDFVLDAPSYKKAKNGAPFRLMEPVSGFIRLKGPEGSLFAVGQAYKGLVRVERVFML